MDIDIAALKALVRERSLSLDLVVTSIEEALLSAYNHQPGRRPAPGSFSIAAPGMSRSTLQEFGPDGTIIGETDDTPEGFGRVAASTARQVLTQRLREANSDRTFEEFSAREGDLVGGPSSRAGTRPWCWSTWANSRRSFPREQVPARTTRMAGGSKVVIVSVRRGMKGPMVTVSRTHPELVRKLFALEVPEDRRRCREDRGDVARGRAPVQDRRPQPQSIGQRQRGVYRTHGSAGAAGDG